MIELSGRTIDEPREALRLGSARARSAGGDFPVKAHTNEKHGYWTVTNFASSSKLRRTSGERRSDSDLFEPIENATDRENELEGRVDKAKRGWDGVSDHKDDTVQGEGKLSRPPLPGRSRPTLTKGPQ